MALTLFPFKPAMSSTFLQFLSVVAEQAPRDRQTTGPHQGPRGWRNSCRYRCSPRIGLYLGLYKYEALTLEANDAFVLGIEEGRRNPEPYITAPVLHYL